MYTVPGLSYPNGRMFLDVDSKYMLEYMLTLGLGKAPAKIESLNGSTVLKMADDKEDSASFDGDQPHRPINPVATRDGGRQNPFTPFDGFYGHEETKYVIHWIGKGNFEQCHERAQALFYDQPCFTHSCSFNGVYQPRLEGSMFKGFGQYSKVVDALKLPKNPSLETFQQKVAQVCNEDFTKLSSVAKNGGYGIFDEAKVHKLCWKSLWAYTFLVDGLKFPADSQAITFAPIDSEEASWALGSMIYEVNRLPVSIVQMSYLWIGLLVMLGLFTVWRCTRRRRNHHDQQYIDDHCFRAYNIDHLNGDDCYQHHNSD
eukprot:GHVH01008165.1.p1 GENE.GHVH01008165.1~~GHVH01008165.1.p1  ORF type:complete len:315 (-),score=44.77 GHVH01008165.1:124-1068(-)